MGYVIELIQEFNDAWDSGDGKLFEEVVRRNFAPDAVVTRPEEAPILVSDVLPLWLTEIEAWRPQQHILVNSIEGEDAGVYEYEWVATHNSLLRTTDGREFPASGAQVRNHAAGLVRCKDGKIVSLEAIFSGYQDIVRQLEAVQAAGA